MPSEKILVKGAREHNLKNINVEIPRNKLTVITGLSGSGKSSLAFDTIYAEGQRRYVESLSAYARQFLEQMKKPEVESIEGLSPAISIEQRKAGANPRSTVGTVTEIYDYLRLLFARIGKPHCYRCGRPVTPQTVQQIVDQLLAFPENSKISILGPLVRGRKGEYKEVFATARREGFIRVRIDGKIIEIGRIFPRLDKNRKHNIEIVVDRILKSAKVKGRLSESIEMALKLGGGVVIVNVEKSKGKTEEYLFSEHFACAKCGISFEELSPRMFSFNSPYGACSRCGGLGTRLEVDPDLVIPDEKKSLAEGALEGWRRGGRNLIIYYRRILRALASHYEFSMETPFEKLPKNIQEIILYGSGGEEMGFRHWKGGRPYYYQSDFEGVIPNLERRFKETESEYIKTEILKFMSELPCPLCKGARLRKESLAVTVTGKNIDELVRFSVEKAHKFFSELKLNRRDFQIGREIIKEIKERLNFMVNVGLDYLTLDRQSGTLSGGESQRIRLATQIGSRLVGVVYILDEPSIGLHQRDNFRLLNTLKQLRDLGNTLVVVEHDETTIRSADYIIDLGPGAGRLGGEVVVQGELSEVLGAPASLTGKYLNKKLEIPVPARRRKPPGKSIKIRNARENNLKNINVEIPLGLFVCVTGVSGSGKSTLVDEILYKALAQKFYRSKVKAGKHKDILGIKHIEAVVVIDQSPIGRTPRSNPATYTGAFGPIRELFSKVPEARMRGYKPGRFSFNVKGGRCEACRGDGIIKIEMHFLPDIYVPCDICKGLRFNRETLEVGYKGKNIAEVLDMTVKEALEFFRAVPRIKGKLQTLNDVGLGYIKLGQSATTLSGGEAQRVKLATELSKYGGYIRMNRKSGKTLYLLDEPTTGLHFADIEKLLNVLNRLVEVGNTVLVIEHNLDVIKSADYIIDLGPEGGDSGGWVVAAGSPEEIIRAKKSYTGRFLKKVLG
ncbi:MAG: excinuclease ABC subunit UvrA [Candidatus Ratteibacteria bacterium]|nr:excinuclease ABC subunit UvrA [Candidatus Ratteibacteria bacterium]